jgi:hypothetical protein
MKQNVTYKGKQIRIDANYKIRKNICQCCGKHGLTSLHHWEYAYPISMVRDDTNLALENTTELCFVCHDHANTIRKFHKIPNEIFKKLLELKNGGITDG